MVSPINADTFAMVAAKIEPSDELLIIKKSKSFETAIQSTQSALQSALSTPQKKIKFQL